MNSLIAKYDIPVPRYTSYPTVPYWASSPPLPEQWICLAKSAFEAHPNISLYIHLPFCERLCTYCGCNTHITQRHDVEIPYIKALLKEWQLYLDILPARPVIQSLHLGGGTPTFFHPQHLKHLLQAIFSEAILADDAELSFEAHPGNTTYEHLQTLYSLGFRRISIGVQDFSDDILRLINRKQTAEDVERVTLQARALGYTSINYDIIFGLPKQTTADIEKTSKKIEGLQPDRIAFYSYAHVPWIKPGQRAYDETDLPRGIEKRMLYELGRSNLENIGYQEIGMDHFALETDELFQAQQQEQLHRNFMGYTPHYTQLSIGLGASSISDSWTAFVQNEKTVKAYQERVNQGELPFFKGHVLTKEDLVLRKHILNLMCKSHTSWVHKEEQTEALYEGLDRLEEFVADGLVEFTQNALSITAIGKPFVRNICMALDARYWAKTPKGLLFSQAV